LFRQSNVNHVIDIVLVSTNCITVLIAFMSSFCMAAGCLSKQVQQAAHKLQNKSEDRITHLKLLRQAFCQGTALIDAFIR